jgi:GNAT superfamily N-acetyltransferase
LQPAGPEQLFDVLAVLDEAAAWLDERGVAQWPPRFKPEWVVGALSRGETWLVLLDGDLAGTVTLEWADGLWDDVPGAAGYVHRMAVRRSAAGVGKHVLDWAAAAVRRNGRDLLRLDCVASNTRLRSYYEAAGFVHRGDALLGKTLLSRYERAIGSISKP